VRALPGTPAELADIRVGHMEVSAQVPAGGVRCPTAAAPTPEVDVRAKFSDELPKTGAVAGATVLAGLLLAAGALALRRRLS
jgi:LPXTG-motif cell wall-anchored protein